jgi:hypothetical protein
VAAGFRQVAGGHGGVTTGHQGLHGIDIEGGASGGEALDVLLSLGMGCTAGEALCLMQKEEGVYDPSVLAAALACFGEDPSAHLPDFTTVGWSTLQEGDTLADDIPSETGALLLTKGCRVTPNLKRMLQQMASGGRMPETVRIKATHKGGRPTETTTEAVGPG